MNGNLGKNVVTFFILGLFFYVCSPLLMPILMGGVFAVLVFPVMPHLEKKCRLKPPMASAVLTVALSLIVVLPITLLIFIGAKTALQQVKVFRELPHDTGASLGTNLMNLPGVQTALEKVSRWFPVQTEEALTAAGDIARAAGLKIADLLGGFLTQLPGLSMGLVIMLISLYFFLLDGTSLVEYIRRNSVFGPDQTERLIKSFAGMCRSVILATVASGFAQSLVFSTVCLLLGVGNVPLIGLVMFIASFLPLVGATPVSLAVTVHQFVTGDRSIAVILLVTALVVSVMDNFIRPAVLRGAAKLHPLIAFVAAFGGLQVFGFTGVFVGPIIAGLAVVMIQQLTRPHFSKRMLEE